MSRPLLGLIVVIALGGCDAAAPAERQTEPRSRATSAALSPGQAPAPRVALLATRPGAAETSLHFAQPGAPSVAPEVARFAHAPDGEVRGQLLPGGSRVVVVADMERRRDPSFGAWLMAIEPGHDPMALAKGCYHASRPLVLPSGRVLVQRGDAGPELDLALAGDGQLRTDTLRIDEVDPGSGATRTVHEFQGYIAHLAGTLDGEVFLYRVAHQSADLVAVTIATGAVRVLASPVPAQARDFSVDPSTRSLVYANHDGAGWQVERLALESGARQLVARADGMWVTPSAWPGGGVLLNDGRGAVVQSGSGPNRPLGPGFDEVRALSPNGRHVALLHRVPSDFAEAFVTSVDGSELSRVAGPAGSRLEIAGFLP